MCIYIHIYYICIWTIVCDGAEAHGNGNAHVSPRVNAYICAYICVYIHVYIHTYIYIYIYICVCVCVYTYNTSCG